MARLDLGWMARLLWGGFLFWCSFASPSDAAGPANDGDEDVLPQPCATDPAYRDFENVQADAYPSDKDLRFRIFLAHNVQEEVQANVERALAQRIADRRAVLTVPKGFDRELKVELARMKIPTCYENPFLYFMIDKYARDIETSRREL